MRLYTAVREGKEEIFVSLDGGVNGFFLADAGIDFADMNELIAKWDDALRERIENSAMRTVPMAPVATIELRSPIVRPLQDILCLGLNYRDHVEECEDVNLETRQTDAIYFAKRAARIIGDGEGMPLHADICDSLDYESELGVVIGKDAYKVAKEDVDDYIFG